MDNLLEVEQLRQKLQIELDGAKTKIERNCMGQFSTPAQLSNNILEFAKTLINEGNSITFLDPAVGTGSFLSALFKAFPLTQLEKIVGIEVDSHYGEPGKKLWSKSITQYKIDDFTQLDPPESIEEKFNLIICNPPYVRHQNIAYDKKLLKERVYESAHIQLSGLAGLYCYFIGLAHAWMRPNGLAGWLVPSEFMDVNYGKALKDYLLNEVTLIQIHRFDPNQLQFDDALVSSSLLWFINRKPDKNHKVRFTFGRKLDNPEFDKLITLDILKEEKKWTRYPIQEHETTIKPTLLGDYFSIKRGIATGNNNYFILSSLEIEKMQLPISQFKPILPSPRYLETEIIEPDILGNPSLKNPLFVLDSNLSLNEIKTNHPTLYEYIIEGLNNGVDKRYLCKKRKIWYSQEKRLESPFYCTYLGRSNTKKNAFRFILNNSKAIVSNSYLILYPKKNLQKEIEAQPELKNNIHHELNSIGQSLMIQEGRVYGGGLYKLEPKELANVDASRIKDLLQRIN